MAEPEISLPQPELVTGPIPAQQEKAAPDEGPDESPDESIARPARVMRIGSMTKQLLEEVRQAPLDEASRQRLRDIYDNSIEELAGVLSPELRDELSRVTLPFREATTPSESELRIAQAQLVGWLEGLFHGIQAALFAQQMAARAQLEEMHRGLPAGPDADLGRPAGYL